MVFHLQMALFNYHAVLLWFQDKFHGFSF